MPLSKQTQLIHDIVMIVIKRLQINQILALTNP